MEKGGEKVKSPFETFFFQSGKKGEKEMG